MYNHAKIMSCNCRRLNRETVSQAVNGHLKSGISPKFALKLPFFGLTKSLKPYIQLKS